MNTEIEIYLKSVFGPLGNIMNMLAGRNHETMLKIIKLLSRLNQQRVLRALNAEEASCWAMISLVPFDKTKLCAYARSTVSDNPVFSIPIEGKVIELIDEAVFPPILESRHQFTCGTFRELFGEFTPVPTLSEFLDDEYLKRFGYCLCDPADTVAIARHITTGGNSFSNSLSLGIVLVGSTLIKLGETGNLFGFTHRPGNAPGSDKIVLSHFIPTSPFVGNVRWMFRRLGSHEITDR